MSAALRGGGWEGRGELACYFACTPLVVIDRSVVPVVVAVVVVVAIVVVVVVGLERDGALFGPSAAVEVLDDSVTGCTNPFFFVML